MISWDYSCVGSCYSCFIFYSVNIDAISIIVLFIFRTKDVKRLKTKRLKLKVHFQMSKDTIFSRPHTKALCNASHRSLVGTDTWPNRQLVPKGFVSRLKSKLVLQQPSSSETLSSATRSMIYKINYKLSVQTHKRLLTWSAHRENNLRGS